jgi:hypothetical protein
VNPAAAPVQSLWLSLHQSSRRAAALRRQTAHRIDFDIRGGNRHHDQRLHAQTRCGERHALGMVARRSGNHATRFLLFGQARHHRVGAAQLKAVHRLTVFTLHQNNVIEARREFFHFCSGVTCTAS